MSGNDWWKSMSLVCGRN